MSERFPDIDWWCDKCGAYLNSQVGFDDHKYIWKCTECGFKSSISGDNIRYDESVDRKTKDSDSSIIDGLFHCLRKKDNAPY